MNHFARLLSMGLVARAVAHRQRLQARAQQPGDEGFPESHGRVGELIIFAGFPWSGAAGAVCVPTLLGRPANVGGGPVHLSCRG